MLHVFAMSSDLWEVNCINPIEMRTLKLIKLFFQLSSQICQCQNVFTPSVILFLLAWDNMRSLS